MSIWPEHKTKDYDSGKPDPAESSLDADRRSLGELVAARANFHITRRGGSVLLSRGLFIFTCKVRNVSWQATCPYHRKNKTTGCTKGGPFLDQHLRAIQFLKA